jgi:hypothetical protein
MQKVVQSSLKISVGFPAPELEQYGFETLVDLII